LTDFSQFKTYEKCGFFNRNASNDADIVKIVSDWKSTHFYSSRAFLPFYPNVVFLCLPGSFTPALSRSFHRKIIFHSDGHSVVNKDKKPVHRYQNKRKIIFRYSFDENLCTGFEIQMPQCLYLSRFCTQTVQCEAFAVISAYRRSQCFIGYSVVVLV